MKLALTNAREIDRLMTLLNEINSVHKYENLPEDYSEWEFNKEDYPLIHKLMRGCNNPEQFLTNLFREFYSIHHQRILWNLSTLLDNCADKSLRHLDYNPTIKKSFEFVDKISKLTKGSAPSAGYFQQLIEEAEAINDLDKND